MDRRPPRGCGSARGLEREDDGESAARAFSTFHPDPAAMLLYDALAEKEAKSHSREAAVVDVRGAMEPLEDLREVAGGDADALVGHIDERFTAPLGDLHVDLAPIGAGFYGVLDQGLNDPTDPARGVGGDERRIRRHAD